MAKVMIVDDNVDIVDTLKSIMELEEHETELAYNGEEFVNKVEEVNPDLVLLDVMMPGLTTKDIMSILNEKEMDDLKIILVTVVRFSQSQKDLLMKESCIKDFVSKPFDIPVLLDKVNSVLH